MESGYSARPIEEKSNVKGCVLSMIEAGFVICGNSSNRDEKNTKVLLFYAYRCGPNLACLIGK